METPAGRFVAKLRGSGHGVAALVAEILVAELAERLGLPVPERVLVELAAGVPSDDRNDELADLLRASTGTNVGLRWLDGAGEASAETLRGLSDDFAARVLWLDGLVMNPDRAARNPNVLLWNGQPWLIDHGTALPFQHRWARVREDSPRVPWRYDDHVFAERVSLLAEHDEDLAHRFTREALEAAIARVPDEFLLAVRPKDEPRRSRAAYHAFLWKRLKPPRPFVPEMG